MKSETILNDEQQQEVDELMEGELTKEVLVEVEEHESRTSSKVIDDEQFGSEEVLGTSKSELGFEKITQEALGTEHLPGYEMFERDLGIDGDSYIPLKKFLVYYQNSIRQDTVCYAINEKTKVDNRPHGLVFSKAGEGKSTIKNQIKRVMEDFKALEGCIEITGVSHAEQYIGKVTYEGRSPNKKRIEKKGVMAYKCVLNDECQGMLNEKNDVYAKCQRIKRIAMDPYGDNKISKKLVDDAPEDALEYDSPSSVFDFAHPEELESAFFTTGSFRRYMAFNVTADPIIKLKEITEFKFETKILTKTWKIFLDEIYKTQTQVKFKEETLDIISQFHKCILIYLLNHKNANAFRYALQTRYALRVMFAKHVLILSKAKKEKIPTRETTILACNDVILFVLKSIETYNELGNMGTSTDVWGGVVEEDAQALEYLLMKKCTTRENSSITISKFQTLLAHFHGCRKTQSRAVYYKLKSGGFINSATHGQYGSRVWLTFIPTEVNLDTDNFDPLIFWKSMFEGVGNKKGKKGGKTPSFKDFVCEMTEKAQGVGSVGIMGCVCISQYIYNTHRFVSKNKNKNNIYIQGIGRNPEVPTPSKKTPHNTTFTQGSVKKKEIQGSKHVKIAQNSPTPSNPKLTDRKTQFYDAEECNNIKPNHTKKDVLQYLMNNPKATKEKLFDKFGSGYMKFKNELKKEGLI